MTPGRTQRDLRRLRGEESLKFLERRPSQPDQAPRVFSFTQLFLGRPRTRGPPPPWEPTLPLPARQCPAPALARPESRSQRLPSRTRPPTMPGAPLALSSLAPGTRGSALPGGSAGPPRPASSPRSAEPPRPLVPAAPLESPSCPRGQPLESCPVWGLGSPRRREAPPHPQVTLCPRAPAASRLPRPPELVATRTPSPVTPGLVQRPPPHAGTGLPSGALPSGGLQSGSQPRAAPGSVGTKFSLSGLGALLGWLRGAGVGGKRGGVGEGAVRH